MSVSARTRRTIEVGVIAIGVGQAASPFAQAVAESGRSVALVKRRHLGGSCANFGCTPSKAALASAAHADDARHFARFGVMAGEVTADFGAVMARARGRLRGPFNGGGRTQEW